MSQKSYYKIFVKKDERVGTGTPCYSAYVPDLGISVDGDTLEEVQQNMNEALRFHIECLAEEGETILVNEPDHCLVFDTSIDIPPRLATS